eukprot:tig00000074_g1196.t1
MKRMRSFFDSELHRAASDRSGERDFSERAVFFQNTGTAIERTLLKLGYSDVSLEKLEPAEILRQDVSAYTKQVILGLQGKALVTSYTNPPQRVLLEQMELKEIPRNVFSTIRNPDPAQPFVFYQATRKVQPTPECRIDDFEKICIDAMNVAAAPLLPIAREGEQARVLDGEAAKKYGGAELIVAGRITRTPAKAAWVRLPAAAS